MSLAKRCQECERVRDEGGEKFVAMIALDVPETLLRATADAAHRMTLHFCDAWCLYCWTSKQPRHPKLAKLREQWKKDAKKK